jgi:trehalose-6-phosphate synthase
MVKNPQHKDPFAIPAGSFIIVDTAYPHKPFTIGVDPLDAVPDDPDRVKEIHEALIEHPKADEAVAGMQGVADPEESAGRD